MNFEAHTAPDSSVHFILSGGATSLAANAGNAGARTTSSSPTVSQLLNASNAEYTGLTPTGLTPFDVNGAQLSYDNTLVGAVASVWETASDQLILAWQGTTDLWQVINDIGVYAGAVTLADTDSLNFAKTVLSDAAAKGIASANVFLTGQSLGGIEAEYVAQQTGLAGIAFDPTGVPNNSDAHSGSNFVDIVTAGDPVGNYASDLKTEQPFAPSSGLNHYGQVITIGSAADNTTLHNDVHSWGNIFLDPLVIANLYGLIQDFHYIGVQGHDLGVTFSPYSSSTDGSGEQNRPVWSVGGDTISQLISAAQSKGNLTAHLSPAISHGW